MNQVALMTPGNFSPEQLQLLKNTICRGLTDEQLQLFLYACIRTGLDPFMKQIHPLLHNDKKLGKKVLTIMTGIDGYRLIAERTGKYSPGREPSFTYDDNGNVFSSTAYIKKMTSDGTWHEIAATAFFSEYAKRDYNGNVTAFWQDMPHNQLAKCAESLCLRKGFPADLSGIYTKEEMEQADCEILQPEASKEEIKASVEEVKKEPLQIISEHQALELMKILAACDIKYQMDVYGSLRKSRGIEDIRNLPVDLYPRLLTAATKNKEKQLAKEMEVCAN